MRQAYADRECGLYRGSDRVGLRRGSSHLCNVPALNVSPVPSRLAAARARATSATLQPMQRKAAMWITSGTPSGVG